MKKLPKLLSEWYEADGRTEFSQRAEALAERDGLPIGEATMRLASERPDLLKLHDQWQQACSTGDREGLPAWLRTAHFLLFSEQDKPAGDLPAETPISRFNTAVREKAAALVAGGLDELSALTRAQDELFSDLPEPTKAYILSEIG